MGKHLLVLGVMHLASTTINALNLFREIKARPNLSQAAHIIESDPLLQRDLENKQYTAFIPNNVAFSQYQGNKYGNFISYHLVNIPYMVQDLPSEMNSHLMGNPRLYVSKYPSGKPPTSGWEDVDYYINNAKITYANVNVTNDYGYAQVLHIVDQVIIQTIPNWPFGSKDINPDVKTLLSNPELYGLKDSNSVSNFVERVKQLKIMDTFDISGTNTFFIPVNKAPIDLMDKEDVHGHIVPKRVLFTRTGQGEEFPSYAFTDNLKKLISIEKVSNPEDETPVFYVKCNSKSGDNAHKTGISLARIVHGNIPVKNGVVHLIDRPLMVVASSINSYLQEEEGQLKLFYELMREHYYELTKMLRERFDLTLFAPSNLAFEYINEDIFKNVKRNKEKLGKLLKLHIVPRRLTTDVIINKSSGLEETLSNHRKLYFSTNYSNTSNPIVSLEGAGVNAIITTPNIATNNGVVHIINRILGIPSMTAREQLLEHDMLRSTAALSTQDEWNIRLDDRDEIFTFFAPSNDAWDSIKREMPSVYKRLFTGDFSYNVKHILQRHMMVGYKLNIDELSYIIRNGTIRGNFRQERIQMTRGRIYFQTKIDKYVEGSSYDNEYYVEWNGIQARVIHPDVECVNGIVHVIDKVLMMDRNVTVSSSPASLTTEHIYTICTTFITFIAAKMYLDLYVS